MTLPDPADVADRTDEDLLQLVREGDHQAFSNLYERYFKRIYHFVSRRIGNTADVDETVQDVFSNVFASVDSYRGEAPLAAWIFGVTRRTIASRFKKKRLPTVSLEAVEADLTAWVAGTTSLSPTALETIECKQRVATLQQLAQNHLTREQQVLFELHHLQHRPIQEIALTLNKSEDSVKSNLYRARRILLSH